MTNRENVTITIGAALLIPMFYIGGVLGSTFTPTHTEDLYDTEPHNVGALVGLVLGLVLWALLFGAIALLRAPKPEPIEVDPIDPAEDA
jgi:hypothetical protein